MEKLFFLILNKFETNSIKNHEKRECNRFGTQCWISSTILFTEILIIFKFDWELVTKPPPWHISLIWIVLFVVLVSWTIWHFFIYPSLKSSTSLVNKTVNDHKIENSVSQEDQIVKNGFVQNSKKSKSKKLKK